jgi:hypothetical protein
MSTKQLSYFQTRMKSDALSRCGLATFTSQYCRTPFKYADNDFTARVPFVHGLLIAASFSIMKD